jgi:hypothetical protein
MKDPQTTLILIVAILLMALWRTGKLTRILNLAFANAPKKK